MISVYTESTWAADSKYLLVLGNARKNLKNQRFPSDDKKYAFYML